MDSDPIPLNSGWGTTEGRRRKDGLREMDVHPVPSRMSGNPAESV